MRPVFRIGTIGADHHSCRYRGKTCDPPGAAGSAGVDPLRRRCRLRRRQRKGGGAETPVTTGFECDADLTYRDMQVKGHLTRLTTGTLTLDIDEPETLKGMTMQWDGETVSVKMYGLSFGLDPAAVPETALGRSLLAAWTPPCIPRGRGRSPKTAWSPTGRLRRRLHHHLRSGDGQPAVPGTPLGPAKGHLYQFRPQNNLICTGPCVLHGLFFAIPCQHAGYRLYWL